MVLSDPSSVHTRRSGPWEHRLLDSSSLGLHSGHVGRKHHPHRLDSGRCPPGTGVGNRFWYAKDWNCRTYGSLVKPVWCANLESPIIFLVVSRSLLVGGSSTGQCSCSAMVKSSLLKGSAMLACVGTRRRICLRQCLLCHVQCEPSKLFRGAWLPEPLMMAWVAASLSQSCMYVGVSSGLTKIGVMMAAQASRKYMKALLLAKCFSNLGGTVPLNTNGLWESGWNTTAAHPLVMDGEGMVSSSCFKRSWHRSCLSPSL